MNKKRKFFKVYGCSTQPISFLLIPIKILMIIFTELIRWRIWWSFVCLLFSKKNSSSCGRLVMVPARSYSLKELRRKLLGKLHYKKTVSQQHTVFTHERAATVTMPKCILQTPWIESGPWRLGTKDTVLWLVKWKWGSYKADQWLPAPWDPFPQLSKIIEGGQSRLMPFLNLLKKLTVLYRDFFCSQLQL